MHAFTGDRACVSTARPFFRRFWIHPASGMCRKKTYCTISLQSVSVLSYSVSGVLRWNDNEVWSWHKHSTNNRCFLCVFVCTFSDIYDVSHRVISVINTLNGNRLTVKRFLVPEFSGAIDEGFKYTPTHDTTNHNTIKPDKHPFFFFFLLMIWNHLIHGRMNKFKGWINCS